MQIVPSCWRALSGQESEGRSAGRGEKRMGGRRKVRDALEGEKGSMARGSGAADNEKDACSIWEAAVSDGVTRSGEGRKAGEGRSVWTW